MSQDIGIVERLTKHRAATYALWALFFFAALIGAAFLLTERGERLGFVLFATALVGLGFANALIPGVKAALSKFMKGYFRFTAWFVIAVAPVLLFRWLSHAVLVDASALLQALILITWGLLLVSAGFVVLYGRTRDFLFNRLGRMGAAPPIAYSANLLLIALQFFAVATFLLHESGSVTLKTGSASQLSSGTVADFFLWHFLNAIPVLKITDTLLWEPPLIYDQAEIGWILLAFKITVIMPVVVAFSWSWKQFREGTGTSAA